MRPRLCYVVSSAITVKAFLLEHIRAAADRYDVAVVANTGERGALRALGVPVDITPVGIERRVAPAADLAALARLARFFRRSRFDLVHSVTPKAGLLAMLAAALARTPVRVHTFTGQVWATRGGAARAALKGFDRLIAALATHLLADSASQREFLVAEGVATAAKIGVLARGSVCGVDAARFRPDAGARARVRAEAGIPPDAVLFLYLGRLARDKGLIDLAHAFSGIGEAWLLLVGPDEESLVPEIRAACGAAGARLRLAGYTDCPEEFMAAADVFVLPSYREGFGSVVIEAAAAGVPAIGTRIYGVSDAIVDGETGFLVPAREPALLGERMRELAADAALRRRLGEAARARAVRDFSMAELTRATLAYYEERLGEAGRHA
jgi:glycosyltransferase involved in cell wall biosynthesis